jgi:16S rRNA (cytosine1402-N4)-methyltransferase
MSAAFAHTTVLLHETVEGVFTRPDGVYVDGTFGRGGHSRLLLSKLGPAGRLIAIDRDPEAVAAAGGIEDPRFTIRHAAFADMADELAALGVNQVDGVMLDLGVSSPQIDNPERGFSFRADGPLDMRFDPTTQDITAADLVNGWTHQQIADCLYGLGEEHLSRQIAGAIIDFRKKKPFERTSELAEVVASVKKVRGKIHPATQTFQALRLAVNDELGAILELLPQLLTVLRPGGQAAIITFHSLEDRIVKRFLQAEAKKGTIELQPKKPIQPTRQEMLDNPRSRSAKLRIFTTTS